MAKPAPRNYRAHLRRRLSQGDRHRRRTRWHSLPASIPYVMCWRKHLLREPNRDWFASAKSIVHSPTSSTRISPQHPKRAKSSGKYSAELASTIPRRCPHPTTSPKTQKAIKKAICQYNAYIKSPQKDNQKKKSPKYFQSHLIYFAREEFKETDSAKAIQKRIYRIVQLLFNVLPLENILIEASTLMNNLELKNPIISLLKTHLIEKWINEVHLTI